MPRDRKERELVYFEDRGTVYDAPIDILWDFMLKDDEFHPRAHHSSLRKMKWKDLNEITGEGTCEVVRGGKWDKMRFRITTIPPFVRIQEDLAGRYAGQKKVFLYSPKGKRTVVDVYVLTPKEVAEETRRTLAHAYEEDVPALREFVRAHESVLQSK
jgi:hypothetical protein